MCFGVFYWWESALGFGVFGFFVFDLTMVWILLVDCVRIAEFNHSFVNVLPILMLRKWNKRKENL